MQAVDPSFHLIIYPAQVVNRAKLLRAGKDNAFVKLVRVLRGQGWCQLPRLAVGIGPCRRMDSHLLQRKCCPLGGEIAQYIGSGLRARL